MTKRRVIQRVVVFLLLGAIVNVAVAWECAVWIRIPNATVSSGGGVWDVEGGHAAWLVQRWNRPGVCRIRSTWRDPDCDQTLNGGFPTNRPEPIIPSWATYVLPPQQAKTSWHEHIRIVDARGLPMLAMCSYVSSDVIFSKLGPFEIEHGIVVSETSSVFPLQILPLLPLWPGFAINTIFYAAMLWLLLAVPLALRRRRRMQRGLCPACAYDLRGCVSQTCPECGKPLAK